MNILYLKISQFIMHIERFIAKRTGILSFYYDPSVKCFDDILRVLGLHKTVLLIEVALGITMQDKENITIDNLLDFVKNNVVTVIENGIKHNTNLDVYIYRHYLNIGGQIKC